MASPCTIRILHRPWRFIAMALMACFVLPALAAELDCSQMLSNVAAKKLDKDAVATAQQQLVELGFNPGKADGLLGPRTKSALMQFCGSAQFALNNDLLVMLRNHAAIHRAYPDWTKTLASKDFLKWTEKQADAGAIGQTRQAGDSAGMIALLERYQKRKASVLRSWSDDPVSYMLTKDDFEQLKSREVVSSRIGKLLGKTYADKNEFEAAAGVALKGVAESGEYVQLAEKYAERQTSYRISGESFDELKVANVPDYVLQAVQGMKDLNYPDDALDEAVKTELGKLAERAMEFNPELVKLAEISPSGASLTENSLAKFAEAQQGDPLAAAILERLWKLKDVKYKNDKALAWAMKKVLMEIEEQIDNSLPVILGHAEEVPAYVFDKKRVQEITQKIKESAVPEIYLELLGDTQDVDYPDPDLFWLATKARICPDSSNNIFRGIIFDVLEKHAADKVDESLLEELKAAKLPPAVLAAVLDKLGALQGQKFDDTKALEYEVDKLFVQLSEQYDQYRTLVLAQAKKTHPFDKTKKIQWSGGLCDCVHNNLAREVYGLYPYWMAGEKQAIDFSVQSRIGYHGLSFDNKGNIPHASLWSELDPGFIQEARKYRSKVDLVIYRDNWKTWEQLSAEEKSTAFRNLATNIVSLVETPLTDFFSRVKPYISLGTSPPPVRGDGVTLYFSGYPQDTESVDAFSVFISSLGDQLSAQGRSSSVNIMFRSAEIGRGIYDYSKLIALMGSIEKNDRKLDSLFLVLLQEPTTDDKKLLRRNIENGGLRGEDRMKLLRNVAMVLTYDGRNVNQLKDDVIYAKDDFGGVGFWTQPVASAVAAAATAGSSPSISDVLHENYLDAVSGETMLKPAVCQFVCPNRWAFRIAWDIFIVVLLANIILYFCVCAWRNFLDTHFIHFIAGVVVPALLLTLALLFCDPAWEKISRGNGILIFVIAAILAYSIWSYRDKKRKADLP